MKANEDNPLYNKKVQAILNKLISEEVIANQFYIGCIAAACKCQKALFNDMFVEIAVDELDDHCKNLCQWAIENDYSVPYKFKDYEKFADAKVVKQFDKLKDDQEATYYIQEAIYSENLALKSYEQAMQYDELPQDLNAILLQNYYDEVDHAEKLQTLKIAVEGQVSLTNW